MDLTKSSVDSGLLCYQEKVKEALDMAEKTASLTLQQKTASLTLQQAMAKTLASQGHPRVHS